MIGPAGFEGRWHLSRRIDDRLAKQEGSLSGEAMFTPIGPRTLRYDETGQFRLGRGPEFQAKRSYQWIFEASEVVVNFEDGRDFHRFVPSGAAAGTDHPCGDDFYQVAYDFTRWPAWQATWTVKGPRKDYTSVSHYMRS